MMYSTVHVYVCTVQTILLVSYGTRYGTVPYQYQCQVPGSQVPLLPDTLCTGTSSWYLQGGSAKYSMFFTNKFSKLLEKDRDFCRSAKWSKRILIRTLVFLFHVQGPSIPFFRVSARRSRAHQSVSYIVFQVDY